jgi:large subunit ribosomal protein L21
MYAVIRTGGKQYRVAENQRVTVERLPGDPGDTVRLDDVLMIAEDGAAPMFDAPDLAKAAVFAEVVAQTRGDKVIVFKKNRRKNYRRTKGHRQDQTMLRIASISASGEAPAAKAKVEKPDPAPEAAETPAPEGADATSTEATAPETEEAKKVAASEPTAEAKVEAPAATASDSESKE